MIRINLLPPEEKRPRVKVSPSLPYLIAGVFGGMALVTSIVVWMVWLNLRNRYLLNYVRLKEKYLSYKPRVEEINSMIREYDDLKSKIVVCESLSNERMKKIRLLSEIPKVVPQYAWLEKIDFTKGTSKMEGYAYNNLVIADLVSNLNNSPLFVDVKLEEIKGVLYKGKNFVKFKIAFKLK